MGDPLFEVINNRLTAIEGELHAQRLLLQQVNTFSGETRKLVGPCGIPVTPEELLVQTLFGVKFYVVASDQLMTPQLVVYRQWEANLSQLILRLAPAGSVFVDIGANLGYFTCIVAAGMGTTPNSRVIAIEPNPHMLRLLTINTRINWSMAPVHIVPVAVAEKSGTCTLHVPAYAPGNATLAPMSDVSQQTVATARDVMTSIEVEVRRLDDVLRDEPRVNLMKVDVEGFEIAAFRGAMETLERPGLRIIFEWAPAQISKAGFQPAELLSIFRGLGYRLFDTDGYLGDPLASERDDGAILAMPYGNIFAVRDP